MPKLLIRSLPEDTPALHNVKACHARDPHCSCANPVPTKALVSPFKVIMLPTAIGSSALPANNLPVLARRALVHS